MYSWKNQKTFCTPLLMFEMRFKKDENIEECSIVPAHCTSIYLPYLVWYILYVHTALQQHVILKI